MKTIKFLLACAVTSVLISCQKDDPILEQPENGQQAEADPTAKSNLSTVSIHEAESFLSNEMKRAKLEKEDGLGIEFVLDSIRQVDITNTDAKMTIIPARTKFEHIKSQVLQIKIDGELQTVLFNEIPEEQSSKNQTASRALNGYVAVSDLSGKVLNTYRVNSGNIAGELNLNLNNTSGACCDYYLDEVVLVAPQKNSPYYNNLGNTSNVFNYYQWTRSINNYSTMGVAYANYYYEQAVRALDDKIDHKDLNAKADCVFKKMTSNGNNINWILKNFQDGKTPSKFNLKFQMSSTLGNETNASTATPAQSGIPNTFVISLNAKTIEGRTTLGIARTILHEGIHARLWEFVYSHEGKVNRNDFPGIYEYRRLYSYNWDHQQMATFYRSTIAEGLKQFDNARHSDAFYNALAWEGLSEIKDANGNHDKIYTEAWKKLSPSEQQQILQTIANEKKDGSKDCKN